MTLEKLTELRKEQEARKRWAIMYRLLLRGQALAHGDATLFADFGNGAYIARTELERHTMRMVEIRVRELREEIEDVRERRNEQEKELDKHAPNSLMRNAIAEAIKLMDRQIQEAEEVLGESA